MPITEKKVMNKEAAWELVDSALQQGRRALSEYEAKQVLAFYDIPVVRETLVHERQELAAVLEQIGYPLVMKGCGHSIAHKTESNLVCLDLRTRAEAEQAFAAIREAVKDAGGGVLLQKMVSGRRELVLGMTRDPQFGPCVMFGLGGIFTEILEDIAFRKAPLDRSQAFEMMHEIKGRKILEGVRGMSPADTELLADMLVGVGRIGLDMKAVAEIDINPVLISEGRPIVVDALLVLGSQD